MTAVDGGSTPRKWSISRRVLLGAALSGTLVIAGGLYYRGRSAPPRPAFGANAWLALAGRTATLSLPVIEMGQGAASTLAQAAADELDLPWESIRVRALEVDPALYGDAGYITAGSYSIRQHFTAVRRMAAAARMLLLEAAAQRWQIDVDACRTQDGAVYGPRAEQRLDYGALVAEASLRTPPRDPELRPREGWQHIGKERPRHALAEIVTGRQRYGIDFSLPAMRYAAVASAPARTLAVANMDEAAARAIRGVQAVHRVEDSVAVVADSWHAAARGLVALDVRWEQRESTTDEPPNALLARLRVDTPRAAPADPDGGARFDYSVPMLAQMALEPVNASVRVRHDHVDVWVSTQNAHAVRNRIAEVLGRPAHAVQVHPQPCGGGFGRRLQTDYVVTAALIAREVGGDAPLKVLWSREHDTAITHGRPAARLQALLEAHHSPGSAEQAKFTLRVLGNHAPLEGLEPTSYTNLRLRIDAQAIPSSLRTGPWRSVAFSQNLFFLEAFANDVANLRREDPLALRLRWLGSGSGAERARRVLRLATDAAKWRVEGKSGPALRRGQGLALAECFGSAVCLVVQVHLPSPGEVRVERITAAADVGLAVNPDGVRAQITGAILQALSAATSEELSANGVGIDAMNFDTYPLLRLPAAPPVDVLLADTASDALGGVGEIGVPALAPALVDAIAHAGGPRLRALPLRRHGIVLV